MGKIQFSFGLLQLLFILTKTQSEPCLLCKEGSWLTYPEAVVDIPPQYTVNTYGLTQLTCAQINYFAVFGYLDTFTCDVIEAGLLSPVCNCTSDPDYAPVEDNSVSSNADDSPCIVCGEGFTVGYPEKSVKIPGNYLVSSVTCYQVEQLSLMGLIDQSYCSFVQELVQDCTCVPIDDSNSTPEISGVCYVCGEGSTVLNPDYAVSVPPGIPVDSLTCDQAEKAAKLGLIPEQFCGLAMNEIQNSGCGCQPYVYEVEGEDQSDYPSAAPSNAPSDSPSNTPSDAPSDTPSDTPSDATSDAASYIASDVASDVSSEVSSEVSFDAPTYSQKVKQNSVPAPTWKYPSKPTWKA